MTFTKLPSIPPNLSDICKSSFVWILKQLIQTNSYFPQEKSCQKYLRGICRNVYITPGAVDEEGQPIQRFTVTRLNALIVISMRCVSRSDLPISRLFSYSSKKELFSKAFQNLYFFLKKSAARTWIAQESVIGRGVCG